MQFQIPLIMQKCRVLNSTDVGIYIGWNLNDAGLRSCVPVCETWLCCISLTSVMLLYFLFPCSKNSVSATLRMRSANGSN
jgi:hypothetical protein